MKQNKRSILERDLRKVISPKQAVGKVAQQLIIRLLQLPKEKLGKFYFDDLAKLVDVSVGRDDFINGVFVLLGPDVNVLAQKFEAYTGKQGEYSPVDGVTITKILQSKNYINPVTSEKLTEEQFSEQVLIYFEVTDKFWGNYQ